MAAQKQLTAYLRLWAAANILRILSGFVAGTALKDTVQSQPTTLLLTLLFLALLSPGRPAVAVSALALRVATNVAKGPWMGNSQLWGVFTDVALLAALLPEATRWFAPLSTDAEARVVRAAAATIRVQLSIFYLASGAWKLNSSFLHRDYSCGSLFTVQPLEYLPDDVLFASPVVAALARSIAAVGPAATLILETLIPVLHFLDPADHPVAARAGVFATVGFHMVIGLTPPPSNVSSYGVTTVTRLFFCVPAACAATLDDALSLRTPAVLAALAAAPAVALAVVDPLHRGAASTVQGSGRDLHLAYYAALSVFFVVSCCRGEKSDAGAEAKDGAEASPPSRDGPWSRVQVAAAVFYAFGMPVLGLQEKGGCLMFSQLRLHGGSNHYVLPTSLLQRARVDGAGDDAFAGGVVRVNDYSLAWVGSPFAEHMGPRTLRVVRDVAGVPGEYVWAAKQTTYDRAVPPPRKWAYTISNLGLRRLVATARAQGEALALDYERLDGATGDEAWRTAAPGTRVKLVLGADGSVETCVAGGKPCGARELALVGPPSPRSAFFAGMLLPQPNPIVPGMTEEMHCVTWG